MDRFSEDSCAAILQQDFTDERLRHSSPRLKTGFPQLDALLGGGMAPGLTVLGASPGLGKSTFALQLATNISRNGTPVLYFSQEMPKRRMVAKMVARQFFETSPRPRSRAEARQSFFTADELLNSETYAALREDEKKWAGYQAAHKSLEENWDIIFKDAPLSVPKIVDKVRSFTEGDPRSPLVIVDYLQILPRPDGRVISERQTVDDNLIRLRALAQGDPPVPVLLISSLNRSSYNEPVQMESFKESGGIEFSADVLLGLQFTADGEGGRRPDLTARKRDFPRDMELVILKQRSGPTGDRISFNYYAEFDCFEERDPGAPSPARQSGPSMGGAAGAFTSPAPKSKKGPTAFVNNTLIANDLRRGRVGERMAQAGGSELLGFDPQVWMECHSLGRKGDVPTTKYRLSGVLSRYDLYVADAVYSLFRNKEYTFSLGQVLRALSGDSKQTGTAQKKREIRESLDRLMAATIEIDWTQELETRTKKKGGGQAEEPILKGNFLSLVPVLPQEGGVPAQAEEDILRYRFPQDSIGANRVPMPLYRYADAVNQIVSFPQGLLCVENSAGRKLSDTGENTMLKRLVVARLQLVNNPNNDGRDYLCKFRYVSKSHGVETGVLDALGIDPRLDRARARRIHQTMDVILGYYTRIGYIGGYQEQKDRKSVTGFDITGKIASPEDLFG